MPDINNFDDFLSAMEQDPALQDAVRNHVLGAEFLQLPAIARRQEELITLAIERQMELASTLRDVAEQISGYALASSRVITTTVERQDQIEADIAELKAAQARLEASVRGVLESQSRLEGDVGELKAGQAHMRGQLNNLRGQLNNMRGQLNNLTGTDYERKVAKRAPRAARRYLDLQRASVAYGITVADSNSIHELLDQATGNGVITHAQADEIERTDLILSGATSTNELAYAVVEVSLTIDEGDIDRAFARARDLHAASRVITKPAVIGTAISDANRQRAEQDGVTVIIMGE